VSEIESQQLKNGSYRYQVTVTHDGLHHFQEFKGPDPNVVWKKAVAKAISLEQKWDRHLAAENKANTKQRQLEDKEEKLRLAEELTAQASADWEALSQILADTLNVDDVVDWNKLKDFSKFSEPKPALPEPPPTIPTALIPRRPEDSDQEFQDRPSIWTRIFDLFMPHKKEERRASLMANLQGAQQDWERDRESRMTAQKQAEDAREASITQMKIKHAEAVAEWEARRDTFKSSQEATNRTVDELKASHTRGEQSAVEEYCGIVLENSSYPDCIPKSWELQYVPDNKTLVIDYQFPNLEDLPTLREVKYIASRDAFDEKHHPAGAVNKAYDSVLYQLALRTIHEIFEADRNVKKIDAVTFNGIVDRLDPATGRRVNSCIMSLQTPCAEFEAINLSAVDPQACFKALKGVGSSKLHSVTPVAPIMRITTDDDRFVSSYAVGETLDEGENLAAMDWEDFEHLVREVFQLEFGQHGAEVKVTRASRDGGIDAVAFDPDPIRGGKIVIQAKRYTKTVGVSAVRDLYGTVMNEGANKGILVSTASFGPEAYAFVKVKPLVLLGGGELLHLMQKHKFNVRIDLNEARLAAKS